MELIFNGVPLLILSSGEIISVPLALTYSKVEAMNITVSAADFSRAAGSAGLQSTADFAAISNEEFLPMQLNVKDFSGSVMAKIAWLSESEVALRVYSKPAFALLQLQNLSLADALSGFTLPFSGLSGGEFSVEDYNTSDLESLCFPLLMRGSFPNNSGVYPNFELGKLGLRHLYPAFSLKFLLNKVFERLSLTLNNGSLPEDWVLAASGSGQEDWGVSEVFATSFSETNQVETVQDFSKSLSFQQITTPGYMKTVTYRVSYSGNYSGSLNLDISNLSASAGLPYSISFFHRGKEDLTLFLEVEGSTIAEGVTDTKSINFSVEAQEGDLLVAVLTIGVWNAVDYSYTFDYEIEPQGFGAELSISSFMPELKVLDLIRLIEQKSGLVFGYDTLLQTFTWFNTAAADSSAVLGLIDFKYEGVKQSLPLLPNSDDNLLNTRLKLSDGSGTADVYVELPQLKRSLSSSADYTYAWPKDIGVFIGRVSEFIRDSVGDLVEFEVADANISLLRFLKLENQPIIFQSSSPMWVTVADSEALLSRGLLHRYGKGEFLVTDLRVSAGTRSESQQFRALYRLSS